MLDCIRHRGPDDSGMYQHGDIAFGHQRLSIIDLSARGRQPMQTEDQRYCIVYNGEVYNYIELRDQLEQLGYRFTSNTDTEVILNSYRQWGSDCLSRFNGMWSFAIWDSVVQELFIARDRFGIKPFIYWQAGETFIFASEIKALLACPPVIAAPNHQAIYDFMIYARVNHAAESFFKGIYQLPPAHYGIVNKKGLSLHRYWDIDSRRSFSGALPLAAEQFRQTFEDAVALRFRSDVEVASCLSGGLDSSSIVCVSDRLRKDGRIRNHRRLNTFSLVFDDPRFDERKWIQSVDAATEIQCHFTAPAETDLIAAVDDLIDVQEEPFGSTSIFGQYMVMKLIGDTGIKVSLDGQGADEILAGYLGYADSYFADLTLQSDPERLSRAIEDFCRVHQLTPSIALERAQRLAATKKHGRHIAVNSKYLTIDFAAKYHNEISLPDRFSSYLKNQLYQDLTTTSIPALLRYEDRNSMAFSIESRVPFLDFRLVELAFSLPADMIVHDGITKFVLRKAMHGVLPPAIADRQDKIGFATPESTWFRDGFRPFLNCIFGSETLRSRGIFDIRSIQAEWNDFKSGARTDPFIIWRIAAIELWFRRFIDAGRR